MINYPTLIDKSNLTGFVKNVAGIYYWRNDINGKGYIGQTLHIRKRCCEYKRMSFRGQTLFYSAVIKYGLNNFTCYKLMECCPSVVALDYWETYWIKRLDTFGPNGYNQTSGGRKCVVGNGVITSGKKRGRKPLNRSKSERMEQNRLRAKKFYDRNAKRLNQDRMDRYWANKENTVQILTE